MHLTELKQKIIIHESAQGKKVQKLRGKLRLVTSIDIVHGLGAFTGMRHT